MGLIEELNGVVAHFEGDTLVLHNGRRFELDAEGGVHVDGERIMSLEPADSRARRIALGSFLIAGMISTMSAL